MTNDKTNVATEPAVIAISQEENNLKAVMLKKQGRVLQVLWTKSTDAGRMNWRSFAAQCASAIEQTEQTQTNSERTFVAGFDSTGVVFYRSVLPKAKEEEIAAMVKLQTEAQLPLPAGQMEFAWRAGTVKDGHIPVTIAAARKEQLQKFVANVIHFRPAKILLDCEAIVEVWKQLFAGNDTKAVVVSIGPRNTRVCLAEFGRLTHNVSLDTGTDDLSAAQGLSDQAAERFAQDMRNVLELFGCPEPMEVPVFVLSDGRSMIESLVSSLGSAGLNAAAVLPELRTLKAQTQLSTEDIYEYRAAIGLGLCALEGRADELDIFDRLYNGNKKQEKKHWLYSPKVACAIAAVILAILVIVSYAIDIAGEKRWTGTKLQTNCNLLIRRHKLIKTVARQRPNLLVLLDEINSVESSGIMLDSFDFKKDQPVRITGQAQSTEQLYKFEKSLENIKHIKDVKRTSSRDPKTKKFKFTMTFHYKNITKKSGRGPARRERL